MLPLTLLRGAQGNQMLVELKNGETFNGTLVNCDSWMNMNLKDVICTSPDGTQFWKMDECYVRGYTVKYLRIPEEVIETISEDSKKTRGVRPTRGRGRGLQLGTRGPRQQQEPGRGRGRGTPGGRGTSDGKGTGTRGRRGRGQ